VPEPAFSLARDERVRTVLMTTQHRGEIMASATQERFAVVTGGSNGIGLELARQFVENGFDVLIAAEDRAPLEQAATQLSSTGRQVLTCSADLALESGVDTLYEAIRATNRPVDVLCVNAGVGLGGAFVETDLKVELRMIDLNVRGAVQLTKLVLRDMVPRRSGKILLTSSIAATMPDPFEAVYGGTKVFLRWFGEALRNELKDTGVGVTVLMPGVTDTDFFRRADMLDTKAGASDKKDDPAMVAKAAFDALQDDKDKIIPTLKNKVLGTTADLMPDTAAAQAHRGLSKPGSARH
jgi:short-subunit dehydrogenase